MTAVPTSGSHLVQEPGPELPTSEDDGNRAFPLYKKGD
jgi:hypothetical protein